MEVELETETSDAFKNALVKAWPLYTARRYRPGHLTDAEHLLMLVAAYTSQNPDLELELHTFLRLANEAFADVEQNPDQLPRHDKYQGDYGAEVLKPMIKETMKWLRGSNEGGPSDPWDQVQACLKLSARNGLAHGRSDNEFLGEAAHCFIDARTWVHG